MKNIKQKYQKVVKYLNHQIKNILFIAQNKTNSIFTKRSKFVKNIDYLIKTTLFKHRDKKNNIFVNKFKIKKIKVSSLNKISNFNKYLISFIGLLFLYLFYLSFPGMYNKTWVQNNIEIKLIKEFQLNFSISSEISYEILPSPHFTIRNVKIYNDNSNTLNALAEIKKLKVFVSQKNLFNKEKLKINHIQINKANFLVQRDDFSFLKNFFNEKFSNKEIDIRNSNIFLKDKNNETISIIKTPKISIYHDILRSVNLINLEGKIFNIPFFLKMDKEVLSSNNLSKLTLEANKLKIKLENTSTNNLKKSSNKSDGLNIFSVINSKFNTKYSVKNNQIIFQSENSKIKNSKIDYNGEMSIEPFGVIMNIDLEKLNVFKLLSTNSIFIEFIKSNLLYNENVSANITVNISDNLGSKLFNSSKIIFNINNGKINFNQSQLINNKIGKINIIDSNLYFQDEALMSYADMDIKIKSSDNLFSFFQTPKNFRKLIENISFKIEYNFLIDKMTVTNFMINDNEPSDKAKILINRFNSEKDNSLDNIISGRNLINKIIIAYDG